MTHLRVLCIFLLLSITLGVSCNRSTSEDRPPLLTTVNLIDRNGMSETISTVDRIKQYQNVDFLEPQPYQKVLRVYSRDAEGNIGAIITTYHPNGQVKQYLDILNNRAFGFYREWFPTGTLKIETQVIGGSPDINPSAERAWLFDGTSHVWDECGKLQAEIVYCKGELEGTSVYYHPNGAIWKKESYKNNELDGSVQVFLESGPLFQETNYIQGSKCGSSYRYWDTDKLAADEEYVNGLLTEAKYYDLNGKLVAKIQEGCGYRAIFGKESLVELQQYYGGKQEGEVKVLNKKGQLLRLYHFKDDFKNGEEIEYRETSYGNSTPQPKLLVTWSKGIIQGPVKTWYDNGRLESQREMSENLKNGMLTAWYRDGSLMMIEEYDHDKLVKGEYYPRGEKYPISQVANGRGTATVYDSEGAFVRKTNYHQGKPVE